MYGHLPKILREFIVEHFGEDKWHSIKSTAHCDKDFDVHKSFDEDVVLNIIEAATQVLSINRAAFLELAGEFYVSYTRKSHHEEFMKNLGRNMLEFLNNVDSMHFYGREEFPNVNMPHLRCAPESEKTAITLHYYSYRQGLHPIVVGMVKAIAKSLYKQEATVILKSITQEEVSQKPEGLREHVIWTITLKGERGPGNMPPPTFVAQTKKNNEKQILKEDVDRVRKRIEEISKRGFVKATNKGAIRAKWRVIAKLAVLGGKLSFSYMYPNAFYLNSYTICNYFPYHFVFNENMHIREAGVELQDLMPSIRNANCLVDAYFELVHPPNTDITFENVKRFVFTPFVFKCQRAQIKSWNGQEDILLKGQMIYLKEHNSFLFMCSPWVKSFKDLEVRKMYFGDMPIHDVTRDMMLVEYDHQMRELYKGGRPAASAKRSLPPAPVEDRFLARSGPVIITKTPPTRTESAFNETPEYWKAQYDHAKVDLDNQRLKNDRLYGAFLPKTVAALLREGKQFTGGSYEKVTVLFSDVVAFARMVTECTAQDVVSMLTNLYREYDRLCQVHDVYRVETIGDAYMAVCGVPDKKPARAQRVANTALGMMLVSEQVVSPLKDFPLHIRVGIHTGPVTCGVVGETLPRFMVMGETVNLASRLESHGVPGKIQISPVTQGCLKEKGFVMEERGAINIRGKGDYVTYFLLRNEKVTDDELLGRGPGQATIAFEDDERPRTGSRRGSRPVNRIHPLNGHGESPPPSGGSKSSGGSK